MHACYFLILAIDFSVLFSFFSPGFEPEMIQNRNQQLETGFPDAKVFESSGAHLVKLRPGMDNSEVLVALGLKKHINILQLSSRTIGGWGEKGIRTEFFTHLKDCKLQIVTSLDSTRFLEWQSSKSALIIVKLGKIRSSKTER